MKISKELLDELKKLYSQYENEVLEAEKNNYLKANTRKTYLLHSDNFIRWVKDEFQPGRRNKE